MLDVSITGTYVYPYHTFLVWFGVYYIKEEQKGGGDFTSTAELKSIGQSDKITVYNTCCMLKGL